MGVLPFHGTLTSASGMDSTSQRPKASKPPPDLMTLLECALRHWRWALVGGCLFALFGGAAGQLVIPAQFKATSMIRLSGPNGVISRPNESSNARREFRSTQQELICMPHVLQRALESPKVQELGELASDPDTVEELGDWLELELPRSSEILRVSVQHDRADIAFLLANAVTDAYLEEVCRADEETLQKRMATLDRLQMTTEDQLRTSWSELQLLARQLGSGDPAILSLQAQAEIENYRDYTRRLRELQSEKREAERLVKSIQESSQVLGTEITEDASMHSVRFAMFQAKLKYEQALTKGGPDHPDAQSAKQEENLLREYYQKTANEAASEPRSRQEEMLAEPLATIARLANEEQALEAMIREIDDRIAVLGGDNAAKLDVLRNDIGRQERLSDRLWQTHETLEIERHADQRVQLVSYASLPTQRDTSKRDKLTLMLAVGGFGFAVVLAAWGEFVTGRLHSFRDATQRTNLETLALLPKLPKTLPGTNGKDTSRMDRIRSQFDVLTARLVHHPQAGQPRMILVTSARWLRERQMVAVHLAAALARTGKKTILVDLDFRKPKADTEALFPVQERVTDLMCSEPCQAVKDLQLASGVANLDYLPAGDGSVEPLSILTHSRLTELLEEAKQRYTYVVIEVSGVLEYPDAVHLGRHADVSLLSIQRNRSVASSVSQAQDRLAQVGLPVFGTMIS